MGIQLSNPSAASWYALYTRSRTEKKLFLELQRTGIEVFLPLQKTLKQWSDRKKWVEEPLLRSYVFVRISEKEYPQVVQTPGVVRFVVFSGKAAVIPDWQIESLRLLLASESELNVVNEVLSEGDPVEVVSGTLAGFRGEIISINGRKKVVLRIAHLGYALEVQVPAGALRIIGMK